MVAFGFLSLPIGDLDRVEQGLIDQLRSQGYSLRNKVWNLEHSEPCPLDEFIPFELQKHWATGGADYDPVPFRTAARRAHGNIPRLLSKAPAQVRLGSGLLVWEAVIDELAQIISQAIPSAVELEGRFWTLSDYPSTAGGRFATLNVGPLELAYFPRNYYIPAGGEKDGPEQLLTIINAECETFVFQSDFPPEANNEEFFLTYLIDGETVGFERLPSSYRLTGVDRIIMPLGRFGMDSFDPEEVEGVRKLAIKVMRRASGAVNSRTHSPELTRLVYERIAQRKQ
jgi:hypothetical protein